MPAHLAYGAGRLAALLAAALVAAPALAAAPPQPVSPFDFIGPLQEATLGGTDSLAGGTLTVHGQRVTIPRNTIVLMPATALTWRELFILAPPPYGPNQTGMALTDLPTPIASWQVHVTGNRVNDEYIAGLVNFAQDSLNTGSGYINFIDYATGELRVGGVLGDPTTGQRIRLNDPLGRFGRAFTPDVRYTIDEDNPTIRTETGFPMCVPRNDPAAGDDALCPQTNRPKDVAGRFVTIYTFPDPAVSVVPNPSLPAPFEIGDYVTYAGIVVRDGASPTVGPVQALPATYVAAYSMVANLGFFTYPGKDPAYVAIDVTILGVGGAPIAGVPQEATVRTKFEGFSTDPTRVIDLFGIDVDPCSGATADRSWGSVAVDPGPPVGAVFGRWRFVPPTRVLSMPVGGIFLPATREVRAKIHGASNGLSGIGLITGQYHAPIGEYLFPENLAIGGPQVPLNFQEFPFLAHGTGPWAGGGPSPLPAGIVGQLSPWPGIPAPTPVTCSTGAPVAPIADAGQPQVAASGVQVQLDGGASVDPNGLPLTYTWTQLAGPTVGLSSSTVARPVFIAPIVPFGSATAILTFQLVVSDSAGSSAPATVDVSVTPQPVSTLPPVASAGALQNVLANAFVTLAGNGSYDPNAPPLPLTYAWSQVAGTPVTLNGADTATPNFFAPSSTTAQTLSFWLVVTNSAGLGATAQADVSVAAVAAPVANAGPAQTVSTVALVQLDGSLSADPQGLPLTYQWTQTSGPAVTLSDPTSAKPTFPAPKSTTRGPAIVTFSLTVSNGFATSAASTVTVTAFPGSDFVTITLFQYRVSKERLDITATTTATGGNAVLTATLDTGASATMTNLGGGNYSITWVGMPVPTSVLVSSSMGGRTLSSAISIRP